MLAHKYNDIYISIGGGDSFDNKKTREEEEMKNIK